MHSLSKFLLFTLQYICIDLQSVAAFVSSRSAASMVRGTNAERMMATSTTSAPAPANARAGAEAGSSEGAIDGAGASALTSAPAEGAGASASASEAASKLSNTAMPSERTLLRCVRYLMVIMTMPAASVALYAYRVFVLTTHLLWRMLTSSRPSSPCSASSGCSRAARSGSSSAAFSTRLPTPRSNTVLTRRL